MFVTLEGMFVIIKSRVLVPLVGPVTICCRPKCNEPNYSSALFDLHNIHSGNMFANLTNITDHDSNDCSGLSWDSQELQAGALQPRATSSPSKPKPRPHSGIRPLRIVNVNCQQLGNKKGPFLNLIDSTKPDIVLATETWFDASVLDSEFFGPGYSVYRRDRPTRGGGVAIAVNSDYISTREVSLEHEDAESVWAKVSIIGCKSLYVGCFYRPHASDVVNLEAFESAVTSLSGRANSIVLIGGDFNLPGWDWRNKCIKPRSPYPGLHSRFADALADGGLTQIIEEPTRGNNILDLIITNRPCQVNRTNVIPGISDHHAVYAEIDIRPIRRKQIPRLVPLYKKARWDKLRQHVDKLADGIRNSEYASNTEQLWRMFCDGLEEGIKLYIPHRMTKSRDSQPWVSRDLKRKIRRRDNAYKKSKRLGKDADEQKFLQLKREVQCDLRRAYWRYVEDTVTPQDSETGEYGSMKKFWTFIKHQRSDHSNVAPLKVAGRLTADPRIKAEALNKQFQSVFTTETDFEFRPPDVAHPTMPAIDITVPGVMKLLQNLKPGKAAGPDSVSPRVLKELAVVVADPLTRIYRKSLSEGRVPSDWKHALVAPIYKKGQRYDPANYRPISLTCIASKVMEHVICSGLMRHATENGIFYSLQHGFRDRRSCETQLLEFVQDIVTNMQDGLQTDVCVLDFSKAFDKVGHRRLIKKLEWYGVGGSVSHWVADFLSDRTQSVVVDGISSDRVPVISGVPQGSVLGPCLFLYYINDIAEQLTSTTRLFADDTMIYMAVKGESDAKLLQADLDRLTQWEDKWMMQFHPDKCEVITITRKKNPQEYEYSIHGHILRHVDCIKYLGLNISADLRWNRHVDRVVAKANGTLNFLRRNLNIRNSRIKAQAYKSLVRPVLEYSSTVWDPYTEGLAHKLEMVQHRAARFALDRYQRTDSVSAMLNALDWQTLAQRRAQARLCMFYRVHYNLVAMDASNFLIRRQHNSSSRTENTLAYGIPFSRTEYHRNSFFPRTIRCWNLLPNNIVCSPSLQSFKSSIVRHLSNCQ